MSEILQGDCLDVMRKMEPNSVDTIITDPPYGLSFMGKKWDYNVPKIEVWTECLRVLKPGGTALVFAGSRTQHRMACNVEDAGFILKDCIMWLYGSGFPKATDISKQLDKVAGKERERTISKESMRFKKYKEQDGCERKTFGELSSDALTPEAQLWNGWKSHGLKPAYEPILVAMKPNDGTYASNALVWGVSGLNIDGGRIGTEERTTSFMAKGSVDAFNRDDNWKPKDGQTTVTGRFPANIILDEEVAKDEPWKRYFYVAKASKAERNAGCEGMEAKELENHSASFDVRMEGGVATNKRTDTARQNHHPTVKPLALMEYLCTLTKTPTGGIVLDPFAGSGTTGVACVNTGREFIGIERDAEYTPIAKNRIKHAKDKMGLFNV